LPEGLLGKENSYLLGALLVSKFQQLAMSRQAKQIAARRDYWIYVDEFANFITPTMAEILSGARKYRIGLTLAHHELHQLQRSPEVASAVMSHPFTRVVFRVGDDDAKKLSEGFAFFEARDLKNLETGQAICRLERSDFDFHLSIPFSATADEAAAAKRRQEVITASREKYGTLRAEIEAALRGAMEEPPAKKRDKANDPSEIPPPAVRPAPSPAAPSVTEPAPVPKPSELASIQADDQAGAQAGQDNGIGGNQHNLIRKRIEAAARKLGFTADREWKIANGKKIDLGLELHDQFIGCEIAITSTVDHEVGNNVAKCLKAGCNHVAVIATSEARLAKIQQGVKACFDASEANRVGYYLPEQFLARLPALAQRATPVKSPGTVRRGKYKVNRHGPSLTPQKWLEREERSHRVMAKQTKRKR